MRERENRGLIDLDVSCLSSELFEQIEGAVVAAVSIDAATNGEAADPMAEVPPELLAKPLKDLTKEERIIVSRARSRAMRAKAGKPVSSQEV